jgi:hypothetical protein
MAAANRPLHRETFSMDVVNVSDAAQPLQGPRRQREELFLDGQVRIVAPIVGRMTRLLAALLRDHLVPTRLDASQHADQPLGHAVVGSDRAGIIVLPNAGGLQIIKGRPTVSARIKDV